MANYHKISVIGRLINDPQVRTFANGGKVAKFGLPIDFTRRKKNPATGQWEGESFIIDVDAFNRENGFKLADVVEQYLRKGSQVYVEGRLKPNEYTDREGKKVFKPVLVVDTLQMLDPRQDGMGGGVDEGGANYAPRQASAPMSSAPAPQRRAQPMQEPAYAPPSEDYGDDHGSMNGSGASSNGANDDIPF